MVVVGTSLLLMGGENDPPANVYQDIWRSDDAGVTWTCVTVTASWAARFQHTGIVVPTVSAASATALPTVLVLGGRVCTGSTFASCRAVGDVWASSDAGVTWVSTSAHSILVVVFFVVFFLKNKIYI
jgi:hypothetical protein